MIIPTLFLKALAKPGKKAPSIGKVLAEIKEPTRKYNESFSPPPYTGKSSADTTKAAYSELEKEVADEKKAIAQKPLPLSERVKATFRNIPNIVRNTYDSTVGYGIASYQNFSTTRAVKKNPKQSVGYVMNGLAQNIGPGHRRGKELKNAGLSPYHLKSNHYEPIEKAHELTIKQIKEFHKKANVTEPDKRNDHIIGHSSGGNYAIYAAGDERIKKLGIKYAQAIAPTPYGIKVRTIGQKLMGAVVDLSVDDVSKSKVARENALKMARRKPVISVDVVAGRYDGLVPVEDTAYKYADKHTIIHHPKSTHFGTSGSNGEINKILVDLIMDQRARYRNKEYKPHYRAAA